MRLRWRLAEVQRDFRHGVVENEVVVSWLNVERRFEVASVESPRKCASYCVRGERSLTLERSDRRSQRAFKNLKRLLSQPDRTAKRHVWRNDGTGKSMRSSSRRTSMVLRPKRQSRRRARQRS